MSIGKAAVAALVLAALALAPEPAHAAACPDKPADQTLTPPKKGGPLNLGELKLQLIDYKCFGQHDGDVAELLAEAKDHVEKQAGAVTNPALVLDIDETSLSNWQLILANDFGFIPEGACASLPKGPCGATAWEQMGVAQAIAPTLALFHAARAKGVTVFFISGRRDSEAVRAATEWNLRTVGYHGWKDLILRPLASKGPVQVFKTAERAKIVAQGFAIIANIGDQKSDLDGGHGERIFQVPNPFYYIP
jgi:predicted secreted acid phosphatase